MYDNIVNKFISFLLSCILIISLLIIGIFAIPPKYAYADSSFTILNVNFPSPLTVSTDGFEYIFYSDTHYRAGILETYNFTGSAIIGAVNNGPNMNKNLYIFTNGNTWYTFTNPSQNTGVQTKQTSYDSVNDIYYGLINNYNYNSTIYVPEYSSYNALRDAAKAFLSDNPDGPSPGGGGAGNGYTANIVVEPGNVAYIGFDSSTFYLQTTIGSLTKSYNSNQRYGWSSYHPNTNAALTLNPSSGNAIPWVINTPKNAIGQSVHWQCSIDGSEVAGYFVVYNPYYDLEDKLNSTINVRVLGGYINVVQYPLTSSTVNGEQISQGDINTFYGAPDYTFQDGTNSPDYIYSTLDQNGNVTTKPAITVPQSPYNYEPDTSSNLITNFTNYLNSLINRIESLLIAPIEKIEQLTSESMNFFDWLSQLWTWLPQDAFNVATTAIIIIIVAGTLKFLWR